MFGGSKPPAFGQTSSGFGTGFNSGTGFGQFGKQATTFGQPSTSLFGATSNQPTGLFGQTQATGFNTAPATTQAGFGGFGQQPQQQQNTSLFGNTAATGNTSLFGSTAGSAFGQNAKPSGFGFGAVQPQTSLFGQPSTSTSATGGFFGQQQPQQQATVGGLFGSTTPAFGGATATNGTAVVKYQPFLGSDTIVKNGQQSNVNTKQHCITFMKEYENKSVEELRLEDYQANRKGPQAGSAVGGGLFGSAQPTGGGLFGNQQPAQPTTGLFGQPTSATQPSTLFGTASNTLGGSSFGQPAPAFGVAQPQTSQTGGLFSKPFSATPVTTPSTFGFGTGNTAFGQTSKPFGTTSATGGLFGQPTAGTSTFGQPAPSTGFGGFGSTATQQQPQQSSLFGGTQPTNTGFGTLGQPTNTAFGGFNATNTSTASSFFGNKPTTGFGTPSAFGQPQTSTATGFGAGFGQQNTGSLFNTSTMNKPTTSFGGFGTGQATTQPTLGTGLNFNSGTSLFGNTAGKPGGLFGNTPAPQGGMFGTTFGGGTATNTLGGLGATTFGGMNTLGTVNTAQPVPIHQQILAMATSPYGDNPIFKDLKPLSGPSEDALKPTNPTAQSAVYESSVTQFKVSPKVGNGIRIKPVTSMLSKKSLFEGLEESDKSLEESFSLKPNAKRLIIKPKSLNQSLTKILNASSTSTGGPQQQQPDKSRLNNTFDQSESFNNQIPLNPIENNESSSGRRTSWLQTNALVKVVRQNNRGNNDSILENTLETLVTGKENVVTVSTSQSGQESATTSPSVTIDKNSNDSLFYNSSLQLDETHTESVLNSDSPPHPTGISLHRSGYYTIPILDDLIPLVDEDGKCVVSDFTIGRHGYGSVYFNDSFDVAGLNLDELVHFRHKEVTIYPDDENKPPVNTGLNRKAQITLDKVWPHDKTLHEPIKDPSRLAAMDFEGYLRRVCDKHDTRFLEYRPDTGSWVFKVEHFSKYGLSDSDDDEPPATADPKRVKLTQMHQQQKPGGGKTMGAIPKTVGKSVEQIYKNNSFQMSDTGVAFLEQAVAYPRLDAYVDDEDYFIDISSENFVNVFQASTKSPSAAIATKIGNDSHKVQLMKASFFIDDDNFDKASIVSDATEGRESPDQMVPSFGRQYEYQLTRAVSPPTQQLNLSKKTTDKPIPALVQQKNQMEVEYQFAIPKPIGPRSLPLIVKPKKVLVNVVDTFIDLHSSVLNQMTDNKSNLAFFHGRKFKVGWGPKNTGMFLNSDNNCNKLQMAHNLYELSKFFNGRPIKDQSSQAVQQLQLGTCKIDDDFEESIVDHLNIQLKYDKVQRDPDSDCPHFEAAGGTDALVEHYELSKTLSPLNELAAYSATVWSLVQALWGYCFELDDIEELSHKDVMFRRDSFSEWIENVVSETNNGNSDQQKGDQHLTQLLDLIMCHKVIEACELAFANNDVNLAMLLAQISGGPAIRQLIKHQLFAWQEVEADKFIATERLKVYMLIAGVSLLDSTNGPLNIFENIDWLKALALNLWYLCSTTSSITDAIINYDNNFQAEEFYAQPPNPAYTKKIKIQSSKPVYDVRYHLLKLYSKRSHPIESLLNPATHTSDAMDYRLSFLLLQILDTLGYHHCSELSRAQIYTSFADQLENYGLWHWAIYILLHLKDRKRRELCIQQILYRYVELSKNPEYLAKETFVVERLQVPAKWIYWAKAVKAGSNRNYHQQAKYLLCAKQWSMAHKVIIQHIAPDAIINDNIVYLESLINQIEDYKSVNNWSTQGQIIADFIEISKKFEVLTLAINEHPNILEQRLEELKPKLSDLCSVIKLFPCPTSKHRLCQTEISLKLLFLIRKFFTSDPYVNSGALMRIALDKLPLPQEYAQEEQRRQLNEFLTEDFRTP